MLRTKFMNHAEYIQRVKTKSDDELRFIIKDCREVIELQSDFNPNIDYYMDEILYCQQELSRRKSIRKTLRYFNENI